MTTQATPRTKRAAAPKGKKATRAKPPARWNVDQTLAFSGRRRSANLRSYAALSKMWVMTVAPVPPMFWVMARLASGTWFPAARPVS